MKHKISYVLLFLMISFLGASAQSEFSLAEIPHTLVWENKPLGVTYNQGKLTIIAGGKTDMFRDPNATYNTDNAPKLLFPADSNFVFTVGITHSFANKWDAGGIVLKADSANWVKFCFEKDYTGAKRVVSVVTRDISDDCNSVALTSNSVFFKMAKAAKVVTLYYSDDRKSWMLVRHFQFESQKPLMLGFLSQSPTGEKCSVTFSGIQYEKKKIKDPYTAE